tara:strand:- start:439 stop:1095 length:657 start_codon:yes stop_codon:yes gene_type:complete
MKLLLLLTFVTTVFSWNPTNYPFLPASTDSTKVRNLIIEAQGPNKRILDIGCGLGYSTSDSPGCLGVDRSKKSIKKAKKLFPEKRFRHSLKPKTLTDEKYDVVTCMFYLNELPRIVRKDTIQAAIDLAEERVVIVDISPEYDPNNDLLKSHKHLNDYIKNCRDELKEFNEHVYVDGLLNIWIYDKKQKAHNNDDTNNTHGNDKKQNRNKKGLGCELAF